ncbi:hypothetical protein ACQ4PT_049365 [Festuca glaucescens]
MAEKAEKAVWDDAHVVHFIAICKEEIGNGNGPLGFLNPIGWKNLVEKFEARTGKKLTNTQLENKWDSMKKEYTWFMELKIAATGLGWDDAKQTVDASKEWWDEHLQRCNNPEKGIKCNHLRYRKRGPKHLDDLDVLFQNAHVTGASASCPGDISSDECSDDDVAAVETTDESAEKKLASSKKAKANKKHKESANDNEEKANKKRKESSNANKEKDEKSPFFRMYAGTCEKIGIAAEKISSSFVPSSAPPTNHVPSIADVMQMAKDCGVQEGTALMHTTTMMIVKPDFREIFRLLQTKEGRFDLLQREHEKEMKRV